MTPPEFLTRVFAATDELAFSLAATPRHLQEAWLEGFDRRVRAQWRPLFAPYFSETDTDADVADVVGRVKSKRDRLERFGAGTA